MNKELKFLRNFPTPPPQKKKWGGRGRVGGVRVGAVRVDVNEELKFL